MNVYKVEASDFLHDDYDSIVVVAESEEHAIEIASKEASVGYNTYFRKEQYPLTAEKIDLTEEGIVHASFNAG